MSDMKLIMERFEKAMDEQMGGIGIMPLKTGVATAAGKAKAQAEARKQSNRNLVKKIQGLGDKKTHIEIEYGDLALPMFDRTQTATGVDMSATMKSYANHGNLILVIKKRMNAAYAFIAGDDASITNPFAADPQAAGRAQKNKDLNVVVIKTRFELAPEIIAKSLLLALKPLDLA